VAPATLHDLLVKLAKSLGCPAPGTTMHLKPLVLNALRADDRPVVLEDVGRVEPRMYRFLQELYYVPDTCLIATTRSRAQIGYLRRLLWDPREELALKPLTRQDSLRLFEQACHAFGGDAFDVAGFRPKVLEAARGNPGQILGMCRLASQPRYRSGCQIKFAPLRIDLLTAFAR
jgi:hypothetical protein